MLPSTPPAFSEQLSEQSAGFFQNGIHNLCRFFPLFIHQMCIHAVGHALVTVPEKAFQLLGADVRGEERCRCVPQIVKADHTKTVFRHQILDLVCNEVRTNLFTARPYTHFVQRKACILLSLF